MRRFKDYINFIYEYRVHVARRAIVFLLVQLLFLVAFILVGVFYAFDLDYPIPQIYVSQFIVLFITGFAVFGTLLTASVFCYPVKSTDGGIYEVVVFMGARRRSLYVDSELKDEYMADAFTNHPLNYKTENGETITVTFIKNKPVLSCDGKYVEPIPEFLWLSEYSVGPSDKPHKVDVFRKAQARYLIVDGELRDAYVADINNNRPLSCTMEDCDPISVYFTKNCPLLKCGDQIVEPTRHKPIVPNENPPKAEKDE